VILKAKKSKMAISTQINIKDYKNKIQRQQELLKANLLNFSPEDKIQVQKCYDDLIEICDKKLALEIEVMQPTFL
jgi:hypothetical protein